MKTKNAFILLSVVLLISLIATICFMYYLDKFTIRGFLDIAAYVAIAILALGVLTMAGGYTAGGVSKESWHSYEAARSISADQEAFDRAERSRMGSSLAFGFVLSGSAILWGTIAFLIYHFLGK